MQSIDNDIDVVFRTLHNMNIMCCEYLQSDKIDKYNADNRSKIFDDVSRRQHYAEMVFAGKKTHKDYITGETLHKSSQMAKNKYGAKSYTSHTYDVDHIVPLKDVHAIAKYNPFLTNEDIRAAANNPLSTNMNYRVTQSKFNRSKGDSLNHAMAYKSIKNREYIQAGKLLVDEAGAVSAIVLDLTGRTVSNSISFLLQNCYQGTRNLFVDVQTTLTTSGVEVYLVVDAIRNLYLISEGRLSVKDATESMCKKISGIAARGMVKGTTERALKEIIVSNRNLVMNKSAHKYIAGISGIAGILAIGVFDALISGDELNSKNILNSVFNNTIGSFEGVVQTAAMLIPIPGLAVTVSLCLMIASACSSIYSLASLADSQMDKKLSKLSSVEVEAIREIAAQNKILRLLIQEKYKMWDDCIEKAYETIWDGIYTGNVNNVSNGLNDILSLIGKKVRFQNEKEFDEFFFKENAVFKF